MSVKIMSAVYESALEKSVKAVALAYADHAHDDGTSIYPSVAYTAWKTGYSDRSVQRATNELIEKGILLHVGFHPSGTKKYKIVVERLPQRPPFKGGDKMSGGDSVSPAGVTTTTKGGDTVSPKSLDNHNDEPLDENNNPAVELINLFTSLTAFFPPHDTTDEYKDNWLQPMERLLESFNGTAEKRIEESIKILREKRYYMKNPKSIYTTAVNWQPADSSSTPAARVASDESGGYHV